jgi:hypothetical protein
MSVEMEFACKNQNPRFCKDGRAAEAQTREAFSKSTEGKSKSQGRIFKAEGREIQIFRFHESRFISGLRGEFKNRPGVHGMPLLTGPTQAPPSSGADRDPDRC